jgi:O-antigen ligase/tetratricopeptide (TPR) repeat protein
MRLFTFPHLFYTAYLIIFITPMFGAIDKAFVQYLAGSLISLTHFVYNYKNGYVKNIYTIPIIGFILFLLLAFISIFYSFNISSSIIEFSRLFTTFFILLNCYFTLLNNKKDLKFIFLVISFAALLEIGAVLLNFVEFYSLAVFEKIGRVGIYNGFAGNINIAAFSILMKLMFLLYYSEKNTNYWVRSILIIILTLGFFTIALTGSRGALLSIWVSLILLITISLIRYFKTKNKSDYLRIFNFIIPFGISTIITELIFDTLRVSYRTGQIFIRGSDSRIEYWKDAIQAFIDYPLTGLGIGSWKIFSISYGSDNMRDYVVPYHAHNDFLQILTELGVFGGILALIIITVPLYYLLRRTVTDINSKNSSLAIYILLFFIVYLMDSLLNFPIARPIQAFTFAIIIGVISVKYLKQIKINETINKGLMIFCLIISIGTIYIHTRAYKSSVEQINLFRDFNKQNFDDSIEIIDEYEDQIPSMTVTAMPISTLKAFYYYSNGDTLGAIKKLMDTKQKNINPFLGLTDAQLSIIYNDLEEYDSAYKYSNMAYNKVQNNVTHSTSLIKAILGMQSNFDQALSIFNDRKNLKSPNIYAGILAIAYTNPDVYNQDTILKISNQARKLFPENDGIKLVNQEYKYGDENVERAIEYDNLGKKYYDNNNYEESYKNYKLASELLPDEYSYYQNMGLAKIGLAEYDEALSYFNYIVDSLLIPKNESKLFTLRGGVHLLKNNVIEGCEDLVIGVRKNDSLAKQLFLGSCQFMINKIEYKY